MCECISIPDISTDGVWLFPTSGSIPDCFHTFTMTNYSNQLIDFAKIAVCLILVSVVEPIFGQNSTLDFHSDIILTNCSQHTDLCSKFNLTCNHVTGKCKCPSKSSVFLSPEIPCLPHKSLGDICLHTLQCNSVQNSICIATFLFPVEITSAPTYKQWFFYNQISDDNEMNFLLNKMFGRCRCKNEYRTSNDKECVYAGRSIPGTKCSLSIDCAHQNSFCDESISQCSCQPGFYFDTQQNLCHAVESLHEQFCISPADCLMPNSSMDCISSQCLCSTGYHYKKGIGCVRNKLCSRGFTWNITLHECQPLIMMETCPLCPLLIRLFLIILIKLAFFNIIRHICTERSRRESHSINHQHQYPLPNMRRFNNVDYANIRRSNGQSSSLLSLPDYETILIDQNSQFDEERLPSYEEAVLALNDATNHHHSESKVS